MKKQEWLPSPNSSPDWRNIIQFHLAKCNRIQICSTRIQLSPKDYVISWQCDVITDHYSFSLCQRLVFRKSAYQTLCISRSKLWELVIFEKNVEFPMGLKFNLRVKSVELTGCGMTTCLNLHWSKWHFAFELQEILFTTPKFRCNSKSILFLRG